MKLVSKSETVKVTFSGGFHRTRAHSVRAKIDHLGSVWISRRVYARLQNIFCGCTGCGCTGIHEATVESADTRFRATVFSDGEDATIGYLAGSEIEKSLSVARSVIDEIYGNLESMV